jgi:hypothetical protein
MEARRFTLSAFVFPAILAVGPFLPPPTTPDPAPAEPAAEPEVQPPAEPCDESEPEYGETASVL